MPKIEVYDPAMCCSTGVCGPVVDPVLPRFAADLDWLKAQGVTVERFNLAQQPGMFNKNEIVKTALTENGTDCLPLVLLDGRIVSRGAYPARDELAEFCGLGPLGQSPVGTGPRSNASAENPNPSAKKARTSLPMAGSGSCCCPSSNGCK